MSPIVEYIKELIRNVLFWFVRTIIRYHQVLKISLINSYDSIMIAVTCPLPLWGLYYYNIMDKSPSILG